MIFTLGKQKNRKTEHFKALLKSDHSSAIVDHVKTNGNNVKWDLSVILAQAKLTTIVRLRRPCLFRSCSHH